MAMNPAKSKLDEVVARAAVAIREQPQPGWVDISHVVLSTLRAATRHSWPVHATLGNLASEDTDNLSPVCARELTRLRSRDSLHIADQVVVDAVRTALDPVTGCIPSTIDLDLDGDICRGVRIEVIGAYARDLVAVAAEVRVAARRALLRVLGPEWDASRLVIDVLVSDIAADLPGW